MEYIDIRYSEIGLKGQNIRFFENKLIENIEKTLLKHNIDAKVKKNYKHLTLETKQIKDTKEVLKKIFGIRYFKICKKIDKDETKLKKELIDFFQIFGKDKTFRINVKRIDKTYPKDSQSLALELGQYICNKCNVSPNLDNPEFIYLVEIEKDYFSISSERIEGLGGLPVGVTGNIISLLSGGIDSPVATWLMMKRGCTPILYTVNCSKDDSFAIIDELKEKLDDYSPEPLELIKESTDDFNKIVLKLAENKSEAYNCLAFKYYLLQRAELLAKEKNAGGIVTGDNLAQVASQTLENLKAQRSDLKIPVYSPLIGLDKEEIIDLSKKIGLYSTSIKKKEDYFFLPKHPVIHAKESDFKHIVDIINNKNNNRE